MTINFAKEKQLMIAIREIAVFGTAFCFACLSLAIARESKTVTVSGVVTDKDGGPVAECDVYFNAQKWVDENSFHAECDNGGAYEISIPAGHYNSIVIYDPKQYGKTKLEFWAWNMTFEHDDVLDAAFDKMEVYSLSTWNSNGGSETIFASFRPMSLDRAISGAPSEQREIEGEQADVLDVAPHLNRSSVTATLDDAILEIKSLQWIYEKISCPPKQDAATTAPSPRSCYMPQVVLQLQRPKLTAGRHRMRIRIRDVESGDFGEGVTQFVSNESGFGF